MDRRALPDRRSPDPEQREIDLGGDRGVGSTEAATEVSTEAGHLPTSDELVELVFAGRRIAQRRRAGQAANPPILIPPVAAAQTPLTWHGIRPSFVSTMVLGGLLMTSISVFKIGGSSDVNAVGITLGDLALLVVGLSNIGPMLGWASRLGVPWLTATGLLLAGSLSVSLAVHPSWPGLVVVVRLLASVSLAQCLLRCNRTEMRVLAKLFGLSLFACVAVATVECLTGAAVGLTWLGENVHPFYVAGQVMLGTGLMANPYSLGSMAIGVSGVVAAMAMDGRLNLKWAVISGGLGGTGAVACGARVSVAGLIALIVFMSAASLAQGHGRKTAFVFVLSTALGASIALVANPTVWTQKAHALRASGHATASRGAAAIEAADVFIANPWIGVGPAKYSQATPQARTKLVADGVGKSTAISHAPEFVPLTIAAEGGLAALVSLVAVIGALSVVIRRRSIAGMVALVGVAIPVATDGYLWTSGEGLALVGFAAGIGVFLARARGSHELFDWTDM